MTLHCAPRPCVSCPYRIDVPSGVWAADEYAKLRGYDSTDHATMPLATFHCHQENATGVPTVCRGWLSVHADSIAVRMAIIDGKVTADDVYATPEVPLHPSGTAAAEHGLRDIERPTREAVELAGKITRLGAGR